MLHPFTAFIAPGGGELIVVMLALLLLFGPKDAPRILRGIQNVLNKMQRAAADFRYKLMYEDVHTPRSGEPENTAICEADQISSEKSQEPPPERHPTDDGSEA